MRCSEWVVGGELRSWGFHMLRDLGQACATLSVPEYAGYRGSINICSTKQIRGASDPLLTVSPGGQALAEPSVGHWPMLASSL